MTLPFMQRQKKVWWPLIDEDLSFEGMFANANMCSRTPNENSVVYLQ